MLLQSLSVATALLVSSASALYYPPFLTPVAGDVLVGGSTYRISWNQTLPEGTIAAEAGTTGELRLGFLIDGTYPYYEGGGFYNASVACNAQVVTKVNLFDGPNYVDVNLVTPQSTGNQSQIIGWYEDTSVHTGVITTVGGTVQVGC
ncbi:hypothetical protein MNV49_007389 [Pseudohyphozyma bogoriensis]|nr:hypothetical protein MNV49_007389 [Pseudohyphozyma bogoriensis]